MTEPTAVVRGLGKALVGRRRNTIYGRQNASRLTYLSSDPHLPEADGYFVVCLLGMIYNVKHDSSKRWESRGRSLLLQAILE